MESRPPHDVPNEFVLEGSNADETKEEERPEDAIPDLPENQATRDFLKNAPSKGLWLPMGLEVKTMQCWRRRWTWRWRRWRSRRAGERVAVA